MCEIIEKFLIFLANATKYLIPCTEIVVLGFFSPTDGVCEEMLNFSPGDKRHNFIMVDSITEKFEFLISKFSAIGSVILDMTGFKGVIVMASFFLITKNYVLKFFL